MLLSEGERKMREEKWYKIRENFGNRCFKTDSGVGSVKAGNDDFSILIPNGYGDGVTRVAVFENEDDFIAENLMSFTGIILAGKCNIYKYDCDCCDVAKELNGKYLIYAYDGLVAFVKKR